MGPWLVITLMILVNLPVNTHRDLHRPGRIPAPASNASTPVIKKAAKPSGDSDFHAMKLNRDPKLRAYLYRFEGKATFQGEPCANASVTVRVETPQGTLFKGGMTDEGGNYSIELALQGARFDPVDWTMNAYTPDSKKAQLIGRRIIMHEDEEDESITVHNALTLQIASL